MKQSLRIIFPLMVILVSCNHHEETIDFTKEGSFTSGVEGPATDHLGNVYAVNYLEEGTIGKVDIDGKTSLHVKLSNGSIGNGIRFLDKNTMLVADYVNHNVLEIDMLTKEIGVYAHEATANQPNDLAISPNKIVYASDPNWSDNTGKLWKVTKEKGFELLEENMGTTNGIAVSNDGTKLYVNESVQRKIWEFDIVDGGYVENKREFISFQDYGLDGMRFDDKGNLYVCRYEKGTVVVISSEGRIINELKLKGKKPTNITFSLDFKKCYVTVADRGCIEELML